MLSHQVIQNKEPNTKVERMVWLSGLVKNIVTFIRVSLQIIKPYNLLCVSKLKAKSNKPCNFRTCT